MEFNDNDDDLISVGGYCVWDSVACLVRWASLTYESCDRWIGNHGYSYPDVDDEDGLS